MRKNLLKKMALLMAMVATAGLMCGYTPVDGTGNPDEWDIDNKQFVYDYADVFTSSEELELQELCEKVGKELGLDLVIVSATDLGGMHEQWYADDFYDYGGYSESGALYLIDLYHDGIALSTAGLGMVYIDDVDVDTILDEIWEEYVDYNYYESAEAFLDTVEDIVEPRKNDKDFKELEDKWYDEGYHDYEDFMAVYSDEVYQAYEESFFTKFQNPLVSLGVAAIIALIVVLIMCISSNPKMTVSSRTYMKQGSFDILGRYDKFTHTTTTSYTVSSSSGGGGSHGGGSRGHSSSHRSSSGRSHGGGSRRR